MALLEKEGMDVGVFIHDPSTEALPEVWCSQSIQGFMDKAMMEFTRKVSEGNAIQNKFRI